MKAAWLEWRAPQSPNSTPPLPPLPSGSVWQDPMGPSAKVVQEMTGHDFSCTHNFCF